MKILKKPLPFGMRYFTIFFAISISSMVFGQTLPIADSLKIMSIMEDWNTAWQTKDVTLATRSYSDDANFTNAFGDKRIGRHEIYSLIKEVFDLPFVMIGNSQVKSIQFQILDNKNVVLYSFTVRKGQKMPDGSTLPDRQTSHMRVFQKNGDTWVIKGHLISDAREKQRSSH